VIRETVEVIVEVEDDETPCTFNAYRMGWVMDYSDAENMLNVVFHPDSTFQYTFWDDDRFRELVDMAMTELDFDTRMGYWQEAEVILLDEYAAVMPLFHYDRNALVSPDVTAEWSPFGSPNIMKWSLPEGRDTLRYVITTEPPTLDVQMATDTTSHFILKQLMESLYRYTADGTIEPSGATGYDVSDDGTVYTIYLREDAVWSDGEPVLAQHYVDGLIRLLEPATAAEYGWLMYIVLGAEPFNTGETDDPSTVGVRAIDDYTLEITLEHAASYFDTILAFSTTYPIRQDVVDEYGDLWYEPGNFVGNGAYVLVEWAHDSSLTLAKNPLYHSADMVTIENIEVPIITENATALAAYERGELDVGAYPSEELPRILEEMPDHLNRLPRPGTYYVGLNTALAPTDNLNLRKALISAVDRRAILDAVLEMPWRIDACGVVPPEIPGYQGCGNVGFDFDLDAAAEYLAAAMAEMGVEDAGDITLQLWYNRGNEDTIEAVEEMWESNLGINVNVVNMEWAAYLDVLDLCND
jgi:oligopeptide transport system substrate-binding protein